MLPVNHPSPTRVLSENKRTASNNDGDESTPDWLTTFDFSASESANDYQYVDGVAESEVSHPFMQVCKTALPHLFTGVSTSTNPCKCTKTRCLKLYCNCFAKGKVCDKSQCKCAGKCANIIGSAEREYAIADAWSKARMKQDFQGRRKRTAVEPGNCRCIKSRCLQKYCACFADGTTCSLNCFCQNCANTVPDDTFSPLPIDTLAFPSALQDSNEKDQLSGTSVGV